ncbi:MAG: nitrate reductase associated protein [Janthinobacterium lividum]
MTHQDRPQLFDFEVPSSENLSYIPLSVRFHLDRSGQRISLDDWQRLPYDARVTLASYAVEDGPGGGALGAADGGAPVSSDAQPAAQLDAQPDAQPDARPDARPDGEADFAALLRAWMQEHAGHLPETGPPPASLPGEDRATLPASVAAQCALAGLDAPSDDAWAALSRFQRYALAKLSRKEASNHDFVPAMTEFRLVRGNAV